MMRGWSVSPDTGERRRTWTEVTRFHVCGGRSFKETSPLPDGHTRPRDLSLELLLLQARVAHAEFQLSPANGGERRQRKSRAGSQIFGKARLKVI